MKLTEEMLQAAMKKAVEHGLLPRRAEPDLHLQNRAALEDILKTALAAGPSLKATTAASSRLSASRKISSNSPVYRGESLATCVHGNFSQRR